MIAAPHVDSLLLMRNAGDAKKPDAVKATQDFDAYFLSQFLKSAGASSEEHMLDGGSAGRMYRDQFFDEIARVLAEHGGIGISQQLADKMDPENETHSNERSSAASSQSAKHEETGV